jgi:hypothetical protein
MILVRAISITRAIGVGGGGGWAEIETLLVPEMAMSKASAISVPEA